jgi:hypothetical protein
MEHETLLTGLSPAHVQLRVVPQAELPSSPVLKPAVQLPGVPLQTQLVTEQLLATAGAVLQLPLLQVLTVAAGHAPPQPTENAL